MKKILENYLRPRSFFAGALVLALFLAIYGWSMADNVPAPEQCCECHRQVCEDTADKRYVHAPFRERQCALCHIAASGTDRIAIAKNDQSQVQWLTESSPQQEIESWFPIPPVLTGKKIILQAEGLGRKMVRMEVQLPNFLEAEQLPAVSRQPEISGLGVDEVKQGVLLTARVIWKTERITDSTVLYGENAPAGKSIVDPRLTKEHEVLLTDLQPGRNYSFVAVSQDIFGNKTVSPAKTFSTRTFFSRPRVEQAKTTEKVTVSGKYFRVDNRFFAKFVANQPIRVRLGTLEGQMINVSTKAASSGRTGKLPPGHLPLTDSRFLNTGVCYSCHPQTKGVLSHPVDVLPKRGMIIDNRAYKLSGDGRITCMSCHMPHASDNEYRVILSDKKKLCLGCHKNFGGGL